MRKKKLLQLCEEWEHEARARLRSREEEKSEYGRKSLMSGAVIYYNTSQQLRAAIKPKFNFDLLLKVFTKYFKRPGSSGL